MGHGPLQFFLMFINGSLDIMFQTNGKMFATNHCKEIHELSGQQTRKKLNDI